LSREDATARIQAGIKGMLVRRSIRSEMQSSGASLAADEEQPSQQLKPAAAAAEDDDDHAEQSDAGDNV